MKYVKNNLSFSVKFSVGNGSKQRVFVFDTHRVYSDTGNVASTGVTAIEDSEYDFLCKECVQFKKLVEHGSLVLTAKPAVSAAEDKAKSLEGENKKLKQQLAEAQAQVTEAADKKQKKLADENKSLKEQLEALKKESEQLKKAIESGADKGGF